MFEEIVFKTGLNPEGIIGLEDSGHAIEYFQKLGIFAIGLDPEKTKTVNHAHVVFNDFNDYFK